MCDFSTRLAAAVSEFDGVISTRIRHGGSRGSANRFRRHPHLLINLTNGAVLKYPLRGRPKDKCRAYFCSIVHGVRRKILDVLGQPVTIGPRRPIAGAAPAHRRPNKIKRMVPRPRYSEPPARTRLTDNPFDCLTTLTDRMAAR